MTWDINRVSELIRLSTAKNIELWKESFKSSNRFDKGGNANKPSSSNASSNKELFIKGMNKELASRPDLDTPAFKLYLMKIALLESGFRPDALNPNSSALGYFLMIKGNRKTGNQWEDMIRLTQSNLAAINRLSPDLKKMAAEKGLDKWDLLALAHFQGAGKLSSIIQGSNPKDASGVSTSAYLNRFRGGKGTVGDFNYNYAHSGNLDEYVSTTRTTPTLEELEETPSENTFLKMINARIAETLAAMNALHEEMSGAKLSPSKSIFASNIDEEPPLYTASTTQYALVPLLVLVQEDNIPFDADTYYAALELRYIPDLLSPLEELINSYSFALGGPVNSDNPIPNFALNTHLRIPAVRYADGGEMDLKLAPTANVDFNVQPLGNVPEMPVNTKAGINASNTSVGLGLAFLNQKLPGLDVMFPNRNVGRELLQQATTLSWNANKDFNASPQFYDDYSWRVKKHHPEVTDNAFNAVKSTTPIVTRNMGTRLGQYLVKGEYMPLTGTVQIDKFNGVFPDVVSHEMGHAFDHKLNLTGNTPGGNLDRTLLNNAYPTVHGVTDDDIDERRAVNTQLRSIIQQRSGKSKADLDTYILNMDTKAMQDAVKGMHTDYLKGTAVSDESLPAIKSALLDVAFNNMLKNPNYNIAAYGGNIYDGTTEKTQLMNNNNSWWGRTVDTVKGFLGIPIEASNRRVSIQKDRGGHYTFNGRTPSDGYTYYDEQTGNTYKFIKGKRTLLHQSASSKRAKKENEKHPLSTENTRLLDGHIGQLSSYGLQNGETAGGWNAAQLYLNVSPLDRISPDVAITDGIRYILNDKDRNNSSKGDEALWKRHLGGTRDMEEMPARGIRFSGDLQGNRNKAEYTGIPDYAKQAILNEILNGHIEVDPNGAWTLRTESMLNNHKDLTQYANFGIRENNDSGIYDVFDTYDFPIEKWYVPNINRYPGKLIEVRDTIHGPNAIPELYDPTFSSKKVKRRYKSLGGAINLFADGGRTLFNKDYPGLAGILFNVVPDTNFNAGNVGFGNIKYMPYGEEGVLYTPDYYYPNPNPSTNNIVYNPNNYISLLAVNEAIALDAISHAGHLDVTYDALHALLSNEYPNEAVMLARDMVGDDKIFEKEMRDPYSETRQFTYPAAVDGQIRAYMFEGMHPDKNDSAYLELNYYPYFREEFLKYESADATRYLSDLSKYVTTGKKPKYVLPEVTVISKKKK